MLAFVGARVAAGPATTIELVKQPLETAAASEDTERIMVTTGSRFKGRRGMW